MTGADSGTGPDGTAGPGADSATGEPAPSAVPTGDAAADPDAEKKAGAQAGGGRRGKPKRKRPFWVEMPVLIVVALVIALLIKAFVVQPFFIPSSSMENTLLVGDKVLVNKLTYDFRSIQPGDIVVFDGAGSWDPATPATKGSSNWAARVYHDTLGKLFSSIAGLFGAEPGQTDYIKRVIGVPGDHVVCCNSRGQVTVNGVPLDEQSYLYPGNTSGSAPPGYSGKFDITVPAGRLWVMGDHRSVSDDSRLRQSSPGDGTIPEGSVVGRAFLIIWPPSQWRVLPIPSTFGQPGVTTPARKSTAAGPLPAAPAASQKLSSALNAGVPVAAAGPWLPLAGGLTGALPLTWLERRLRLRRRTRRDTASTDSR